MSLRIGGLDLSFSSTGFALHTGDTFAYRVPDKYKKDVSDWKRYRCGLIRAEVITQMWMCDLVLIEGYSRGSIQGREELGYLGESVRETLDNIGVPHISIAPMTLKKFATGSGRASKDEMKKAAVDLLGLGPKVRDDEADAAFLRELGLFLVGQSSRMPPSSHTDHLKKIELPEGLQ